MNKPMDEGYKCWVCNLTLIDKKCPDKECAANEVN